MKKVSKKVQIKEKDYFSLNGDSLRKIKGGFAGSGNTDHVCSGGCSTNAGLLEPIKRP